ncbi:hypothetical protein Q31b_01410 [Novipirellula aureliae]|uniref:Uncharacterized protein n=1 Tax=Novipirellula aureliae TaxID=2527966 RepID=A0A5C6E807_9BACT|nr:hypothetical protein Q31b_01410 [Novipirellula aureliae]
MKDPCSVGSCTRSITNSGEAALSSTEFIRYYKLATRHIRTRRFGISAVGVNANFALFCPISVFIAKIRYHLAKIKAYEIRPISLKSCHGGPFLAT